MGGGHSGGGEAPKSVLQQEFSDVDPENGPQKPPDGRSHAHMTISTSPKTLPKEAR